MEMILWILSVSLFMSTSLVSGIPTSSQRCNSELFRLRNGEDFSLHCGSMCDDSKGSDVYSWWRLAEEGGVRVEMRGGEGGELVWEPVSFESGGQYICRCQSGQECLYNVTVLPEVLFTSSAKGIEEGASYSMWCTAEGYPSAVPVVTDKNGAKIPTQYPKMINELKYETTVVIPEAKEEMDYTCSVETKYMGKIIGQAKQELSVPIYDPPEIVYTTEYVITSDSDFGKPGQVLCVVHTSEAAKTYVTWWANGKKLENGEKYHMDSKPSDDRNEKNVVSFKLVVNNLEEYDVGQYLCQVNTDYATEDNQFALIKVDYRKGSKFARIYPTYPEKDYGYSRAFTVMMVVFLVVFFAVVACKMRSRRQSSGPLLPGMGHGKTLMVNSNTGGRFSDPHQGNIMKRK